MADMKIDTVAFLYGPIRGLIGNKERKKISTNFISGDREFTKQYGAEIRYAVHRLSIKNVRHENGCGTIFWG